MEMVTEQENETKRESKTSKKRDEKVTQNKNQDKSQDKTDNEANNNQTKEIETIEIDGSEEKESADESEVSDASSYMKRKAWDEISFIAEHGQVIPASKEEARKVQNTLEKYGIELFDVEQWKNKNWQQIENLIIECNKKEYSVMKRMVEAIRKEKIETNKEKENEKKDIESIKNTYKEASICKGAISKDQHGKENPNETEHSKPNSIRTNHSQQEESPPSKNTKRGEGRGV